MDAVKVVLGVRKLFEDRGPNAYIYEDPVTGTTAAPHAVVKVTFCNPLNEKGRRPFGLIAVGMDTAEEVTAICRILRNGRREHALIAGQLDWTNSSAIEPDLHKIRQERIGTGFVSPEEWNDRVLRRIGVTRALQSVLAIDQFETASLTRKKPEELLDAILQIAGEQTTRQRYDQARVSLATAEQDLADAGRRLREEELRLKELRHKRDRHLQFETAKRQAGDLRKRERWAKWRDADKVQNELRRETALQVQRISGLSEKLNEVSATKLDIDSQSASLSTELGQKRNEYNEFDAALREAERQKATALAQSSPLRVEVERLSSIPCLEVALLSNLDEQFQVDFEQAVVALAKVAEQLDHLETQIEELQAGRVPAPAGLRQLLTEFESRGFRPSVLGEHLHFETQEALEAAAVALSERAWTIAVDSKYWYEAKRIAANYGTHCDLVSDFNNNGAGVNPSYKSVLASCGVTDSRFLPALRAWGLMPYPLLKAGKKVTRSSNMEFQLP